MIGHCGTDPHCWHAGERHCRDAGNDQKTTNTNRKLSPDRAGTSDDRETNAAGEIGGNTAGVVNPGVADSVTRRFR